MKSQRYLAEYSGASVCAIGVFDGVHLGHQALIGAMAADAASRGAKPVVVTFSRDPDEVFCPDEVHKLLSNEERLSILARHAAGVLALPFTRELAARSSGEFLAYLCTKLPGLKAIHVGENFRYGARASGGISELAAWGVEHGVSVTAHPLFSVGNTPVSASRIRTLLAGGNVRRAAELLSRPYTLTGKVMHGAGRGAGLGFATANVEVDGTFAALGAYVYAAYAHLSTSANALTGKTRYKAAVSIGEPPTFSPELQTFNPFFFEAHLLAYEGSLYGKELTLEFVEKLRPMQRFNKHEELIAAVNSNITWVQENL